MAIHQLEYRGLNLHDVIGTVEIAIDADTDSIHIYDTEHIVEPEYDFLTKNFKLSEGFWKMASVLKEKPFLLHDEKNLELWVETLKWIFYSSGRSIKIYQQGKLDVYYDPYLNSKEILLYEKYFSRLTDESSLGK